MSLVQLPKFGGCPHGDNWEAPHILKKPYESVMFPHNDKVDSVEVILDYGEDSQYVLDHLRQVPMATNIGNSLSYGGGVYANTNLKKKTTGFHRPLAKDPSWMPPNGIQWIHEGKLTEEYYSQARLKRGDTEVYGPVEMPGNQAQIDHPISVVGEGKLLVPVTPSAVYDLDVVPEIGDPERMIVIKPAISAMNIEMPYGETEVKVDTTRYIHEKDMISYLTPTFSPFVKMGETVIPFNLKDPLTIALMAQRHLPIDVPLPDGNIVKLRDYTWTIVQANKTSPVQFILEIPPHLKDKPNISVSQAPTVTARYKMVGDLPVPVLKETREYGSVMSPLEMQSYNDQLMVGDPELKDNYHYSSLNTGFVMRPGVDQLIPTEVVFGTKPKLFVQPEPILNYPWV